MKRGEQGMEEKSGGLRWLLVGWREGWGVGGIPSQRLADLEV